MIFSGRIWQVWTPGAMKQIWSLGLGLGLGCKVLTVTWKKTTATHDYLLSDVNLRHVQEEIDLTISSNLRWDSHIMHIVLKASRMLFLLKRRCPLITNIKVRWTPNLSLKVTALLCKILKVITSVDNHLRGSYLSPTKENKYNLRKKQCTLPKVNTEPFLTSYVNGLIFKYKIM